ncbi:MAG: SIMPL domain-containing protein [Spirochaetales bacterium]
MMNRNALFGVVGALPALVLFAVSTPSAYALDSSEQRHIEVSGEASMSVEPDMATVVFAVVSSGEDANEVREENEQRSGSALDTVRALGIVESRIRMQSLRLRPIREWDSDSREYQDRGYEAVREVRVEVHDLEVLADLVAAVFEEGANRLDRVSYDLRDRSQAADEALRAAVEDAERKANTIASALGVQVGRVHSIGEQSFSFPRPMLRTAELESASGDSQAYAPGEIEISAGVTAVFEL